MLDAQVFLQISDSNKWFNDYFGLQVSLLNQERIIEMIKDAIEEKLMNCNTTRIFQTQVIRWLCLHN